jgi:hypothetical protein
MLSPLPASAGCHALILSDIKARIVVNTATCLGLEYRMFLTHEDFDAYAVHLVDLRPLVPNLRSLVVLYNPWKTFAGENFYWSCYHPRMHPRITPEQHGQFIRTMRKVLDDRYGNPRSTDSPPASNVRLLQTTLKL